MAHETPSPTPARSARRRSPSDNGRKNGRDRPRSPGSRKNERNSRELSPYSARRAMTQAKDGNIRNSRQRNRSRSRSRERQVKDRSGRSLNEGSVTSERRSRSVSRRRAPKDSTQERKDTRPKESSKEAFADPKGEGRSDVVSRNRDDSPEPYRKPRERSKDRKRDRSRGKRREPSKDRARDRSRDNKRRRSRDRYRDRSRSRDRGTERRKGKDSRRSASPLPYRSHKRHNRSPSPKRRRRSPSDSVSPQPRSRKPLPSQEVSFRGLDDSKQAPSKYGGAPPTIQKPNFKTTGLLAKDANKVEGTKISLKYHEPPEARKPASSAQWRLFIFKGADTVGTVELFSRSCWLLGRAQEVADIVLEHPSSSSQHAAIQFRYIQKTVEDEFGVRQRTGKVKPYVIDLESSNGTELNDEPLEPGRYYELRDKDLLRFAGSEREYVIMLPPKE